MGNTIFYSLLLIAIMVFWVSRSAKKAGKKKQNNEEKTSEQTGSTDFADNALDPDSTSEAQSAEPLPAGQRTRHEVLPYRGSVSALRQASQSFVAIDFETTGLSPHSDSIIEIGAVRFTNGQEVGRFSSLVNPNRPLSARIVSITGITDDMLAGAPDIGKALPQFLDFVKDSVLVAHNASFDAGFLVAACNAQRVGQGQLRFFDTLPISRFLFPSLENHKLGTVAQHIGVELAHAHRATDDAAAAGAVMLRFLQQQNISVGQSWKVPEPDSPEATYISLLMDILTAGGVDTSHLRFRVDKDMLQVLNLYAAMKIKMGGRLGAYIMLKDTPDTLLASFPSHKIEATPTSEQVFSSRLFFQNSTEDIRALQGVICAHVQDMNDSISDYRKNGKAAERNIEEYLYNYNLIKPAV